MQKHTTSRHTATTHRKSKSIIHNKKTQPNKHKKIIKQHKQSHFSTKPYSYTNSHLTPDPYYQNTLHKTSHRSFTKTSNSNDNNSEEKTNEMSQIVDVQIAKDFLVFNKKSTSEYHCTDQAVQLFKAAGFTQLRERDQWDIKPNGKYFVTRSNASLVAFVVGGEYTPSSPMIGSVAHVDSPCLKLKPISKQDNSGFLQVGIQTYGGLIVNTWFDRDLSVAGRIAVKDSATGKITSKLVCIDEPILRIPNLAIHLDRTVNSDGFKPNTETNLVPILATALADLGFEQSGVNNDDSKFMLPPEGKKAAVEGPCCGDKKGALDKLNATFRLKHHSAFLQRIALEAQVDIKDIIDFDLSLYDTQSPTFNGLYKEFIVARGLDNQLMSFICSRALIDATADAAVVAKAKSFQFVGLFNHEEIGSTSTTGADGNLLTTVLARVNPDPNALAQSTARSLLVSADMAHAIHPNYASKHEVNHKPHLQKGLVIKTNANQRYATGMTSQLEISLAAAEYDIPIQDFVVRNDSLCGSTVGPTLSAATGMRTVDVGVPQFAMHSIREMCGVVDVQSSHKLMTALYTNYDRYEAQIDLE